MRMWSNGMTTGFQPVSAGSIPVFRSYQLKKVGISNDDESSS